MEPYKLGLFTGPFRGQELNVGEATTRNYKVIHRCLTDDLFWSDLVQIIENRAIRIMEEMSMDE